MREGGLVWLPKILFWALSTGRVLYKHVYFLPYCVTIGVNILTYNMKYYIISPSNRLHFLKIFSNFVNFCPNFQIFCHFFEKSHTCPLSRIGPEYTNWLWKKDVLGRKKSCITIKQNSVQTPIVVNQVSVTVTSPPPPRQFASFYCWWF